MGRTSIKLNITDEELKKEYESGVSIIKLSKKCGCSATAIRNNLIRSGCIFRTNEKNLGITNHELKDEYERGATLVDLAKKYNVNPVTILNRLRNAGCEMRLKWKEINLPVTDLELKEEYEKDLTVSTYSLAEKYDCINMYIHKKLKGVGCNMSKRYKHQSVEARKKISIAVLGIDASEWDGFINEHKYCYKFNYNCREKNRNKYDRLCFVCGKNEETNRTKLSVHHVDMNKNQGCDNKEWSLIPVCKSCHRILHTKIWQARIEYLLRLR